MAAPRTNDPLGLSATPNVPSDPARLAGLTAEYGRRQAYAIENLRISYLLQSSRPSFNASLKILRRAVEDGGPLPELTNLDLEFWFAVTYLASKHAEKNGRPDKSSDEDRLFGAREALEGLKPRTGRPKRHILRYHVEALMALMQQATGKPVLASRERNDRYDPGANEPKAQKIIDIVRHVDPSVSQTTVANMILDARRKYAGKRMRFADFLPLYGMTVTPF